MAIHLSNRGRWGRTHPVHANGTRTFGAYPAIQAMPDKEERIIARLGENQLNMQANVEGVKLLAENNTKVSQ